MLTTKPATRKAVPVLNGAGLWRRQPVNTIFFADAHYYHIAIPPSCPPANGTATGYHRHPPKIFLFHRIVSYNVYSSSLLQAASDRYQNFPKFLMPSILSAGQHEVYVVTIITYVLVVIAVALRFWVRRLLKTQIWLDDWLAAAALVIFQESENSGMTSS